MGTTNIELEKAAKKLKLKNFRGVLFIDQFKDMQPKINECGIVGSRSSKSNEDLHWTCWYKNGNNKYYFDSFGLDPDARVVNYLHSPILCNTFQLQHYNESNCGQWCLYILNRLNNGEDFIDIILSIINNKYQ